MFDSSILNTCTKTAKQVTAQHSTAHHVASHSIAQGKAASHSTAQRSTTQHSNHDKLKNRYDEERESKVQSGRKKKTSSARKEKCCSGVSNTTDRRETTERNSERGLWRETEWQMRKLHFCSE